MLKLCLWTCLCALLFIPRAHADSKYATDPVSTIFFHDLTPSTVTVKVMKVIDPTTFIGDDKNVYSLTGLDVPNLQTSKIDFTLEASKTLGLLIEGKDLKLYLTKNRDRGRLNRMNQNVVQAELKQEHIWVEGEMLAAGLARVRTTPSNPELVEEMLKLETQARDAKKGLWANPNLQILSPDKAEGHDNNFEIVEGTPKAAAVANNMIFLNFGDDYKKDFTIGIPSGLRTAFAKKGIDPLQLTHTQLRVRGMIQSYNGPFIEIDHPEQIEILGKVSPFVSTNLPEEEPAPNATGMRTINLPKPPVVETPKVEAPVKPAFIPRKDTATPNE